MNEIIKNCICIYFDFLVGKTINQDNALNSRNRIY